MTKTNHTANKNHKSINVEKEQNERNDRPTDRPTTRTKSNQKKTAAAATLKISNWQRKTNWEQAKKKDSNKNNIYVREEGNWW